MASSIPFLSVTAVLCFLGFVFFCLAKRQGASFSTFPSSLFLIAASICGCLGVLEGFLVINAAWINPKKPFQNAPELFLNYEAAPHVRVKDSILYLQPTSHAYRTFGHIYQTNGMGFRDRGFRFKNSEGNFRILVFGDSLTFGVGVATEHRYTNQLELMLNGIHENSEARDRKTVEVLNFGVPGYSLDQIHDLMKGILEHVEADQVVIGIIDDDLNKTTRYSLKGFTFNKGEDAVTIPMYKNPDRTFQTIPEQEPPEFANTRGFFQKTYFYELLKNRLGWFARDALPSEARWANAFNEFKKIRGLNRKHNLPQPLIALFHYGSVDPDQNDFMHPQGKLAENIEILNFMEERLASENFIVVNTLPLFRKYNRMSIAVSEWEWHPNYLGHYIFAKSIADVLLENNMIS